MRHGEADSNNEKLTMQEIGNNSAFVEQEIQDARRAFRKYVINNERDISYKVLSYVEDKLAENEEKIRQIIEINKNDFSYEGILKLLKKEKEGVNRFKSRNTKTGYYQVPVGVVGVECEGVADSVRSMFKAISTRNAVIILHKNFNMYSTEELLLLIVKECLKNFYIDDNIIQMFEAEEIDLAKLDKIIKKEEDALVIPTTKDIYIYQEDKSFAKEVKDEVIRLKESDVYKDYNIMPICGDFRNVIDYLDNKEIFAICMYTQNEQKAYKFINWINSQNVFVNTGIRKTIRYVDSNNSFYKSRFILHSDIFGGQD